MECSYTTQLKWGIDAKKSEKAFGRFKNRRETQNSTSGPHHLELLLTEKASRCDAHIWLSCSKSQYFYINYTQDDFQLGRNTEVCEQILFPSDDDEDLGEHLPILQLTKLSPSLTMNSITDDERHMFRYMVESVFPDCVCYNTKTGGINPYLDYIVPISMSSPVVFCSIIAAGAYLFYLKHGNDFYKDFSNSYIKNVLRDLSLIIHQKTIDHSNCWDDILVTVLMLCFTDISSKCDQQWLLHLKKGKKLLRNQEVLAHSNEHLLDFFVRYITSHDIMWETVKSSWEVGTGNDENNTYEKLKNNDDTIVDPVLGCSPYLLTLISKISSLGDCYEALRHETPKNREIFEKVILNEASNIALELDGLDQVMTTPKNAHIESSGKELISEIKRLTAKIYLFARIDMTGYSLGGTNHSVTATFREKFQKMRKLTDHIIQLIKRVKTCTMALSWPLFVIGVVTVSYEDRYFVMDKFTRMERYRGLASVRLARETVEATWRERDVAESGNFTWIELVNSKGCTLSLA